MRAVGAFATLFMIVLVLFGIGLLVTAASFRPRRTSSGSFWLRMAGRGVDRWLAARRERNDAAVPWKRYSRVTKSGEMSVGVERVSKDGRVLDSVQLELLDPDDLEAQLDAEARALIRASLYNRTREDKNDSG